jgi:hypothetical protein
LKEKQTEGIVSVSFCWRLPQKKSAKKAQKFCGESKSNYLCTPIATEQAKRQRKCFLHEDTKRDFEVDFQWKTARIRQALQKVH